MTATMSVDPPMEGRTMARGMSSHSETIRLSANALVYVYVFGRLPSSLPEKNRGMSGEL